MSHRWADLGLNLKTTCSINCTENTIDSRHNFSQNPPTPQSPDTLHTIPVDATLNHHQWSEYFIATLVQNDRPAR